MKTSRVTTKINNKQISTDKNVGKKQNDKDV